MARVVRRKALVNDVMQRVQEYLNNRSMRERSLHFEDTYKKQLMAHLAEAGELDKEKGHRSLMLDEPLSIIHYKDKPVERKVIGIQRTHRAGTLSLNEARTMAYLKKKKLLDQCTTTETRVVIDEDKIAALNFDDVIPDKDLAALYDEGDPTYAFNLVYE